MNNNEKTKKIALLVLVMCLGVIIGNAAAGSPKVETKIETKTVTQYRTPQSCKDLAQMDNDFFDKISVVFIDLYDYNTMNSVADYIETNTPTRTSLYSACING